MNTRALGFGFVSAAFGALAIGLPTMQLSGNKNLAGTLAIVGTCIALAVLTRIYPEKRTTP